MVESCCVSHINDHFFDRKWEWPSLMLNPTTNGFIDSVIIWCMNPFIADIFCHIDRLKLHFTSHISVVVIT